MGYLIKTSRKKTSKYLKIKFIRPKNRVFIRKEKNRETEKFENIFKYFNRIVYV